MRYRLRTLIKLLAVGPPVLAAIAWLAGFGQAGPLALLMAVYVCLALLLIYASKLVESLAPARRPNGVCAFCLLPKRPLAEGPDNVLICRDCAVHCLQIIEDQASGSATDSPRKSDPGFKTDWPKGGQTGPSKWAVRDSNP